MCKCSQNIKNLTKNSLKIMEDFVNAKNQHYAKT